MVSNWVIIDFSLQNIKFNFQSTQNSGFKPTLLTNSTAYTQTIQIELHPQSSLNGDQTLVVQIITNSEISTSSQYYTLPDSFTSQTLRLPYYEVQPQVLYKSTKITKQFIGGVATSAFLAISISQCFLQVSMDSFWILINADQLLYFSPLVSIKLPTNTLILFKILSFAMGDLHAIEQIYINTLGRLIPPTNYESRSQNYQLIGYDSIGLLDSSGILVMIFSFQVILLILFYMLKVLLFFARGLQIYLNRAIDAFRRALIRTFLQGFLELYLFSLLNIEQIQFSPMSYLVSSVFSIMFAAILSYIPFAFLSILTLPNETLNNESSSAFRRCRVIYTGVNFTSSTGARFYTIFFLIRRQIIVFNLVFLKFCGKVQLGINLFLTLMEIVILARHKPFKQKTDNRVSLLNESLLLLVYLLFLLITIYQQESEGNIRLLLGSITISIACALNIVNIIIMLLQKKKECKKKCKKQKVQASIKYLRKQVGSRSFEENGSPSKHIETTKHSQNESITQLGAGFLSNIGFLERGQNEINRRNTRNERRQALTTVRQMPVESEHQNDLQLQDM